MKLRHELAKFIVGFLYNRSTENTGTDKEEAFVEFSVLELKDAFERSIEAFGRKISLEEVEDSLFYLSRIEALKIEGGFLVVYNRLTIERLEKDNKKRYKLEDYQRLLRFYETRFSKFISSGNMPKDDYRFGRCAKICGRLFRIELCVVSQFVFQRQSAI